MHIWQTGPITQAASGSVEGGFTSFFGFWFGGLSSVPASGFQPAWAKNNNG